MKNKKIIILNILLIILVIVAIVLAVIIGTKYYNRRKNDKELKQLATEVQEEISKIDKQEEIPYIEYKGYQVIGTIQIPKIDIKYPILIETTEDSLKKSITRIGNDKVNEIGNLNLAGHNYLNGSFFGNVNKLEKEDEIIILDLYGEEVKYKIFDKYVTDPNDVNALEQVEKDKKEITLITCINRNKNRLIIKARESK